MRRGLLYNEAMTGQVLFNPLAYIDRLTRGGFSPEQARVSAEALETALPESVATTSDVNELKHEMALLRRDLAETATQLHRDLAASEARLRLEIAQSKNDTLKWIFSFNLALVGAIFAIVKFVH